MKFINYIKETKAEMKHVSWPSRNQAIAFTVMVVVVSAVTAVFLGAFDATLPRFLESLLSR